MMICPRLLMYFRSWTPLNLISCRTAPKPLSVMNQKSNPTSLTPLNWSSLGSSVYETMPNEIRCSMYVYNNSG